MSLCNKFAVIEKELIKDRLRIHNNYIEDENVTETDLIGALSDIPITLNGFQDMTKALSNYSDIEPNNIYLCVGLAEEVGELVGEIKRIYKRDDGKLTESRRTKIAKEAGDVLFILSRLLEDSGITLEEVASLNQLKLLIRRKKGKAVEEKIL